jgi:hypothetical protein
VTVFQGGRAREALLARCGLATQINQAWAGEWAGRPGARQADKTEGAESVESLPRRHKAYFHAHVEGLRADAPAHRAPIHRLLHHLHPKTTHLTSRPARMHRAPLPCYLFIGILKLHAFLGCCFH